MKINPLDKKIGEVEHPLFVMSRSITIITLLPAVISGYIYFCTEIKVFETLAASIAPFSITSIILLFISSVLTNRQFDREAIKEIKLGQIPPHIVSLEHFLEEEHRLKGSGN